MSPYLAAAHPPIQRRIRDIRTILLHQITHQPTRSEIDGRRKQSGENRTSTNFLLLVSLAFNSIGVNPASFATRCALVVFPIPGGPESMTPRKMFIPSLPGFLKFAFTEFDLEEHMRR